VLVNGSCSAFEGKDEACGVGRDRRWWQRGQLIALMAGVLASYVPCGEAQSLLGGGDFESGTAGAWESDGLAGGFSMVVREGGCFSFNDTSGLVLSGSHAMLLRSGSAGRIRSVGIARSPVFEAGTGVVFDALSEVSDGRRTRNPVHFTVAVLDEGGGLLAEHRLHTALVRLAPGCPSDPRTAAFGRHFVDTSAWIGSRIRIEFRQHTNVRGAGYFTLIDNVRYFGPDEAPLFAGLPTAVAGSSFRWGSTLHLDGRLSRHPDYHPDIAPLRYTWYIDGVAEPREGRRVAIDDLPAGNHRVTLFVSDGANVVADQTVVAVGFGGDDLFELDPQEDSSEELEAFPDALSPSPLDPHLIPEESPIDED
jgi:hypothetical protein